MSQLPAHSPVGGSSIARALACPGSAGATEGMIDEESEDAALGGAAHRLAELCLKNDADAWSFVGQELTDANTGAVLGAADKAMADAVQVHVDAVRAAHPDRNQSNFFVEYPFHAATLHPLMFGRADAAYIAEAQRTFHVWDYKHGAGIVVEVKRNKQAMYYAAAMLEVLQLWERVDWVVLHISQPRGFHPGGPLREWSISVADLRAWLDEELLPGIERTLTSTTLQSGAYCMFCPARGHACPALMADVAELEIIMAMIEHGNIEELSNELVAHFLDLGETFKIVRKAAERTAFNRMQHGHSIEGWKLAQAKANRVWKDGAEGAAKEAFGERAITAPELKSPTQIEALAGGEEFCTRWAEKPDKGLTVVRADDARRGVSKDTKALFQAATKQRRSK